MPQCSAAVLANLVANSEYVPTQCVSNACEHIIWGVVQLPADEAHAAEQAEVASMTNLSTPKPKALNHLWTTNGELVTTREEMIAAAHELASDIAPSVLVTGTGRSGATAATRALAALPGHPLVYVEPTILWQMVETWTEHTVGTSYWEPCTSCDSLPGEESGHEERLEATHRRVESSIIAIIRLLGRPWARRRSTGPYAVQLLPWNQGFMLPLLMRAFPRTPRLFVHRPLLPVALSFIASCGMLDGGGEVGHARLPTGGRARCEALPHQRGQCTAWLKKYSTGCMSKDTFGLIVLIDLMGALELGVQTCAADRGWCRLVPHSRLRGLLHDPATRRVLRLNYSDEEAALASRSFERSSKLCVPRPGESDCGPRWVSGARAPHTQAADSEVPARAACLPHVLRTLDMAALPVSARQRHAQVEQDCLMGTGSCAGVGAGVGGGVGGGGDALGGLDVRGRASRIRTALAGMILPAGYYSYSFMAQIIETLPLATRQSTGWSDVLPSLQEWSESSCGRSSSLPDGSIPAVSGVSDWYPHSPLGADAIWRARPPTRWRERGYLRALVGEHTAIRTAIRHDTRGDGFWPGVAPEKPATAPSTFGAYVDELASDRHARSPVSLGACALSDETGRVVDDCLDMDAARRLAQDIVAAASSSSDGSVSGGGESPATGSADVLLRTPATLLPRSGAVPGAGYQDMLVDAKAIVSLSVFNGSTTPFWHSPLTMTMLMPVTHPMTVVLAPAWSLTAHGVGDGCPSSAPAELGHASAWGLADARAAPGSVVHVLQPGDVVTLEPCTQYATFSDPLPPDAAPSAALAYEITVEESIVASSCGAAQRRCLEERSQPIAYPDGVPLLVDSLPPLLYPSHRDGALPASGRGCAIDVRVQKPGLRSEVLSWHGALMSSEPWLAAGLPFLAAVDLRAAAAELQQQAPADMLSVFGNLPTWEDEDLAGSSASTELGCIALLCPSIQWRPNLSATAASARTVSEMAESINVVARVFACGADGPSRRPHARRFASSRHGAMQNLIRTVSAAVAPGAVWDVRPSEADWAPARGIRRIGLFSADVYVTSGRYSSMSHGWHTDSYNTLLVLLEGEKRVRVASPVMGGPILFDVQLRQGQAVFVPAGFFHLVGSDGGAGAGSTASVLYSCALSESYERIGEWTRSNRPATARKDDDDEEDKDEDREYEDAVWGCFADAPQVGAESRRCRDWGWAATSLGMARLHSMGVPSHILLDTTSIRQARS